MRARWRTVTIATFAGLLLGCTADLRTEGSNAEALEQTHFDFTVLPDREHFQQRDLQYKTSVGPYAVFQVTGTQPAFRGPRVLFDRHGSGWSMLCGGTHYFVPDGAGDEAPELQFRLEADDEEVVGAAAQPLRMGECSEAEDVFTERSPAPEGSPEFEERPSVEGAQLELEMEPAPPIGAEVLVRRVALDVPEEMHNESPVIPEVCCDGDYCTLEGAGE